MSGAVTEEGGCTALGERPPKSSCGVYCGHRRDDADHNAFVVVRFSQARCCFLFWPQQAWTTGKLRILGLGVCCIPKNLLNWAALWEIF